MVVALPYIWALPPLFAAAAGLSQMALAVWFLVAP